MAVEIDYVGEGASDDAVARKLIIFVSAIPGTSYRRPQSGVGKQSLDKRLLGLNAGVVFGNAVLVLRDLDQDAPCAGALVSKLIPNKHSRMLFRICVREVEVWLLADTSAYAEFAGISAGKIPKDLEGMPDPKGTILGWAESGQARNLKRHIEDARSKGVPDWRSLGAWHADFAQDFWNPKRAATSGKAPSLSRAMMRLRELLK